jgi:hypothetical protein
MTIRTSPLVPLLLFQSEIEVNEVVVLRYVEGALTPEDTQYSLGASRSCNAGRG